MSLVSAGVHVGSVGLVSTWLDPSQPSDAKQRASLPHCEGRCSAQSSSCDGTYPPQTPLHQRLQATEHRWQTAPQDWQSGMDMWLLLFPDNLIKKGRLRWFGHMEHKDNWCDKMMETELDRENIQERHSGMVLKRMWKVKVWSKRMDKWGRKVKGASG